MRYSFEVEQPIECCCQCPMAIYLSNSDPVGGLYDDGDIQCGLTGNINQSRPADCPLTDITGWISHPCESDNWTMPAVTMNTGGGYTAAIRKDDT